MPKSEDRAIKKARIAQPIDSKRIKESPRPVKAKKLTKTLTEPNPEAISPIVSAKAKGKAKAKENASGPGDVPLPTTFKIIAGSYEKLLYGLEGSVISSDDGEDYTFKLKPMFIFPAHVSCIKAVAASPTGGKWLATGSADEIIKVWDLRRKKEIGGLMHHEGRPRSSVLKCEGRANSMMNCRIDNTSHIPLPLTSAFSLGRWDPLPLPCARLGSSTILKWAQRSG